MEAVRDLPPYSFLAPDRQTLRQVRKRRPSHRGKEATMTTFSLDCVKEFVASLDERMSLSRDEERTWAAPEVAPERRGRPCDAPFERHASLCREFLEHVRRWGRDVFAGREPFDPAVEAVWREEGSRLLDHARAMGLQDFDEATQRSHGAPAGPDAAISAVLDLERLLERWVSPRLAVGPSARGGLVLDPTADAEARRRLEALPTPTGCGLDDPRP
jgi:hypothetical protein